MPPSTLAGPCREPLALPRNERRALLQAGVVPALLVLAVALGVLLARPPLPIDETRYLEVFRESLDGSPLLLRLMGEPYAEKTPLLFWIARLLTWLSLSPEAALRLVPVLASAYTVVVVARLGGRAGLALAGWTQAALWIPFVAVQFLHFDPLLSLAVWSAVDAWVCRRDVRFALWSAVALFAKGPVGLLFLIPFLWATRALRGPERGDLWRATAVLALALVPLAIWAVAAALRGGPEFASALLWERWGGRIGSGASHSRSLLFYLPVAAFGALPGTLCLFGRGERPAPEWVRRLGLALVLVLVAFSLIRGKQAHYLLPAAPGLALWLAWQLEHEPRALARLRSGVRIELALALGVAVASAFALPRVAGSVSLRGRELLAHGGAWLPLALTAAAALLALAATLQARHSARALLLVGIAGSGASLLPLQRLSGELLYPSVLADALTVDPATPIAYLGSAHHGIYHLLAARGDIEKLQGEAGLEEYCARHRGGLVLMDAEERPARLPEHLVAVATDVVHRCEVQIWRVDGEGTGSP